MVLILLTLAQVMLNILFINDFLGAGHELSIFRNQAACLSVGIVLLYLRPAQAYARLFQVGFG